MLTGATELQIHVSASMLEASLLASNFDHFHQETPFCLTMALTVVLLSEFLGLEAAAKDTCPSETAKRR